MAWGGKAHLAATGWGGGYSQAAVCGMGGTARQLWGGTHWGVVVGEGHRAACPASLCLHWTLRAPSLSFACPIPPLGPAGETARSRGWKRRPRGRLLGLGAVSCPPARPGACGVTSGCACSSPAWGKGSRRSAGFHGPVRTASHTTRTAPSMGQGPEQGLSLVVCLTSCPLTSRLEPDILLRAKQDFLKTDSDSDLQ